MVLSNSNSIELLKDILEKHQYETGNTAEYQQVTRLIAHLESEPLDDTTQQMLTEINGYCSYALNPANKNSNTNPYENLISHWVGYLDTLN